jgi:ABC-type branched-subunit amino acid transport system permease subunit
VVMGAALLVILPELLRQASSWQTVKAMPSIVGEVLSKFSDYRMIIYALALILVMLLRPQGIMGVKELWETSWWRKLAAKVRRG